MNGFLRSSILRRKVDRGVEFRIVTVWNSLDAIRQFAGDNPEVAVVPTIVREMMIEYDDTVAHYDVVSGRHRG